MKTWKSKRAVCRSKKSGKFGFKGRCGAWKRQRVKATKPGFLRTSAARDAHRPPATA